MSEYPSQWGYRAVSHPTTVPAADYYRVHADATALAARNAELVALLIAKDATIEAQRSTIETQKAALTRTHQAMGSLQRVASVSVVEQYLSGAIANLTCREIVASRDGVIRLDDSTAAYARGQSAGIGERIRALGGGWSIHRDNPAELTQWCVDEIAGWTARADEPATGADGTIARRTHEGWVDEARAHVRFLEDLATALASDPGRAVTAGPRGR